MGCEIFHVPGGGSAIVCGGRGRRQRCRAHKKPAPYLCDWKLDGKKTCDQPLCASCATSPGPEKHLCPPHAALWAQHPKNPARVDTDAVAKRLAAGDTGPEVRASLEQLGIALTD